VRIGLIGNPRYAGLESALADTVRFAAEHGWKLGRIADPFGHHWEIGHPLLSA